MVCQDEATKEWLNDMATSMTEREGSRLKVVGLDALPTYKRVIAWFTGPPVPTERYILRLHGLNRGLVTENWRVHECSDETKGVRLVLSIDTTSITVLEGLQWRPFSRVGEASFTLLGAKPAGERK
jgi:hypothetical protein